MQPASRTSCEKVRSDPSQSFGPEPPGFSCSVTRAPNEAAQAESNRSDLHSSQRNRAIPSLEPIESVPVTESQWLTATGADQSTPLRPDTLSTSKVWLTARLCSDAHPSQRTTAIPSLEPIRSVPVMESLWICASSADRSKSFRLWQPHEVLE